ncbi:MAG: alpha/beta hydrolase-fold protein [Myxococcota bacterium]
MRFRRRSRTLPVLVALLGGGLIALIGVQPGGAQEVSEFVHQRPLDLLGPEGNEQRVWVTYPRRADGRQHPPGRRYPVVIALHGQGEARRGIARGSLGWNVDYRLPDAYGAFSRRRLSTFDFRSFVTPRHLSAINSRLRTAPFGGVMVVTPYTPDFLSQPDSEALARYGDWLAGDLLEAVRAEFDGAARTRRGTGIDGVSLGGMVSLHVGFAHPEAFGAVGAIQPAIGGQIPTLRDRAAEAQKSQPQAVRLLTSEFDHLRETTERFSGSLCQVDVPHRLLVLPGRHDYAFNRGPGALELLRFAEEVLDQETLP